MQAKKIFYCFFLGVLFLLAICSTAAAASPFRRNVEVIVGYSAGGGSDICARTFSKIINDEKYLPATLNVLNKPGGNGAVAYTYVNGKRKDPHYLGFVTPAFFTVPMLTKTPFTYKDFTPICIFGADDWFYMVRTESPYKNFADFVKAAKAKPGEIRFGGPGTGGSNHIAVLEMAEQVGISVNYVPLLAGAEVMSAILGGHVDIGILNVSESANFIEAKQLRALATPAKKRVPLSPDTPTLQELGYNCTMSMMRALVAPGDIPKEAMEAYAAALKKVSEHPNWKSEFVDKYMFSAEFMGPEESKKAFDQAAAVYESNLKKLGLLQ